MAETRWTKSVGPTEITKISVGPMDNNVYLIAVGDTVAVVDAGSNEADAVREAIGDREFVSILQTHNHGDHVVTLPAIVKDTSVPVFAHPSDALPVKASDLVDGQLIEIAGAVRIAVLHTPGHTPGSVCFLLQEGGESHLFAGDTLFPGGPGNTFGDAKAFETIIGSLEKLFALPDDTHVYPGHGDDTTIGNEKPNLEEWRVRGW